jgi:hypothetical protein
MQSGFARSRGFFRCRAAPKVAFASSAKHVEVPNVETAEALCFAGSPSVRVNGVDVEGAWVHAAGLSCRTYVNRPVREGVPPFELIQRAVRRAAGGVNENQ